MKYCLAIVCLLGCQSDRVADRSAEPARPVAQTTPTLVHAQIQLYPALRCSECHETMYKQWHDSAHARAEVAPLYVAMRAGATDAATCDRCHAPQTRIADSGLRAEEGVTCETCHIIKDVKLGSGAPEVVFELADNRKFGPLCDAKKTYFHKTECSPLHGEARLCAGCHQWTISADVPVFTEYDEWAASTYADHMACQECHMPAITSLIATGVDARNDVPHHGWLGSDGTIRKQAIEMRATLVASAPRARVTVSLTNAEAGHKVPAGLPGKQLVLRAAVVDRKGVALAHDDRIYSRVMVDAAGQEVPFYAATRVESDNRIAPKETKEETFELDAPVDADILVTLTWRSVSPTIAERVGAKAEEAPLLETRLKVGGGVPKTSGVKR